MRFRSFWTFLVNERMGRRRPSPVSPEDIVQPEDYQMRVSFEERARQLRQAIEAIDVTRELWSMRPRKH